MITKTKPPHFSWQFDWLQITAVALVIILAILIDGNLVYRDLKAQDVVGTIPIVIGELPDTQPQQIFQQKYQRIAQFKITTESTDPVSITGLTFSGRGTLSYQIIMLLGRYRLVADCEEVELGRGITWLYQDGDYLAQSVDFIQPFNLDILHPLIVDVSTDFIGQYNETFGISLIDILTSEPVELHGLPVVAKLFEVKERW